MFRYPHEVRALIQPGDRVLDIGGAEEVFPRANVVLDIVPYEQRQPGPLSGEPEHFTADSWFVADICKSEIWEKFRYKEFDFVLCSHTLEDVRDPIYVCEQMNRVAKRGYLEVPSRLRECTRQNARERSAGWPHHRWIVDFIDGYLVFTHKGEWAHEFNYPGRRRRDCLGDYRLQFLGLEWEGHFGYYERMAKGPVIEAENIFHHFANYPFDKPIGPIFKVEKIEQDPRTFRGHREFLLPIERTEAPEETLARYLKRKSGLKAWLGRLGS